MYQRVISNKKVKNGNKPEPGNMGRNKMARINPEQKLIPNKKFKIGNVLNSLLKETPNKKVTKKKPYKKDYADLGKMMEAVMDMNSKPKRKRM